MSLARRTALTAALGLAVAGVAGCGTPTVPLDQQQRQTPHGTTPATSSGSSAPPVEPVRLTSNVPENATAVTVDTLIMFEASHGTLESVTATATVTDSKGKSEQVTVPGGLSEARTVWTATDGLDPGATYSVAVVAKAADGSPASFSRTFTTETLTLKQQIFPEIYPLDGMTVGVGMAAIIRFDIDVKDKANVEKHLAVTVSPAQEGSWYWQDEREVHYRPKTYWQPGTTVKVDARLNGVKAGEKLYGQKSRTWSFTIGRKVVAKTDLAKCVTTVYVDDKLARTIPISAGKPGFITRSGTKVVSEKLRRTPMQSETNDINDPEYYNLANVEYAIRLTNTGEFFHAAPWNAAKFGKVNASHGCTGMSLADAAWLFDAMNIGDPAEFTGSNRPMEIGNGYTDWDLTWDEVKQRSALK